MVYHIILYIQQYTIEQQQKNFNVEVNNVEVYNVEVHNVEVEIVEVDNVEVEIVEVDNVEDLQR